MRFCHLRLRQQPATASLMLQEMKASAKLFGPFYDGRGDGGFSTTLLKGNVLAGEVRRRSGGDRHNGHCVTFH